MWLLDAPSPFAPTSEMLAFLKECEEIKDHDPYGQIQRAMAKVREYLGEAAARAQQDRANLVWTVTVPSPLAPMSKLQAFLKSMETNPGRDDPDVKRAVKRVRKYLAETDPLSLDIIMSPSNQSTPGWFSG
jgi:hypothetical protein